MILPGRPPWCDFCPYRDRPASWRSGRSAWWPAERASWSGADWGGGSGRGLACGCAIARRHGGESCTGGEPTGPLHAAWAMPWAHGAAGAGTGIGGGSSLLSRGGPDVALQRCRRLDAGQEGWQPSRANGQPPQVPDQE
jgi:hypothetical protein